MAIKRNGIPPDIPHAEAAKPVGRRRPERPRRKVIVTLKHRIPDPPTTSEDDHHHFGSHETGQDAQKSIEQGALGSSEANTCDVAFERCFGSDETARAALLQAINDCVVFNGRGFFQNRRENRIAMLVLAYLLLLELVRGGEEAIKIAISRLPLDTRVRSPSLKKPELIAVQLAAKPENEPQRKLCSDYGSLLLVARVKGLSQTDFVGWVEEADIGDCKIKAKRIRAALRAGVPAEIEEDLPIPAPAGTIDEPWVQISHGRAAEVGGSYSASISEAILSPVADQIEAGASSGSLPTILRRVADLLELAERPTRRSDDDVFPL